MKLVFLGIELNGAVNKFRCARKLLKRRNLLSCAEDAPGPKNRPKTAQNGPIPSGRHINLIYAVDSIMIRVML